MIKKNTRKVIFGKKKESDHFCLCNPGIMGFGILFSAPEGNQESVTVTINKNPESKFHWQVIWNPIYLESGIHLTRSVESRIQECLLLPYVGPVANPGEGPAGPASRLFLDQTEARSAETRSPFYPGVDDPTPSPLIWRSEPAIGGNTIPCDSLNFLYIKYERSLVIQIIHSRDFFP